MAKSNSWGGKRPGQGRKPGKKARVYLHLSEAGAKSLFLLTKHRRALLGKPELTEEQLVEELVDAAWREVEQEYQEAAEIASEPFIL